MIQPALDFTGRQLKDMGIQTVEQHSADWQEYAADLIADLAATGRRFTTDDFHGRLQWMPHHPNAIGAAFRRAQKNQVIKRVGYRQSERAAAHARVIAIYEGADG